MTRGFSRWSFLAKLLFFVEFVMHRRVNASPLATYSSNQTVINKPDKLSVLVIVPFSGPETRSMEACRAAIDMVFETVNTQHPDILPGYVVTPLFKDEESNGLLAPKLLVEFSRSFEQLPLDETQSFYQSPIVIGPLYSTGCEKAAQLLHYLKLVGFGLGCLSPSMTGNRKLFPNIYRSRSPVELGVIPRLKFIKTIGKWSRIAVIASIGSVRDFAGAILLIKESVKRGVEIAWFNAVIDMTSSVAESLKESDTRIIVIEITAPVLLINFFCHSFNAGITGSKYVFIAWTTSFTDPLSLPRIIWNGCTRAMVLDQMKITYWIGEITVSNIRLNNATSSLGYNVAKFDVLFDAKMGVTSYDQSQDTTQRHQCHDTAMRALLTLDRAEKKLKQRNLSLRDYVKFPSLVMAVVNQSASEADYVGLRVGLQKYSARLELDNEPLSVGYWTYSPRNKLYDYIYLVTRQQNKSTFDIEDYQLTEVGDTQLTWTTGNGKPPKERSVRIRSLDATSQQYLGIAASFAAMLMLFQAFGIWHIWKLRGDRDSIKTLNRLKVIPAFGCIFLDIAAVFQLMIFENHSSVTCLLQGFFSSLGLAIVHGFLIARMALSNYNATSVHTLNPCHSSVMTSTITVTNSHYPHSRRNSHFNPVNAYPVYGNGRAMAVRAARAAALRRNMIRVSQQLAPIAEEEITIGAGEKMILLSIAVATLITCAVVATWFGVDVPDVVYFIDAPSYDAATDTYREVAIGRCLSGNWIRWLVVLSGCNMIVVAFEVFLAYRVNNLRVVNFPKDSRQIRTAILNDFVLSVAFCVLLLVRPAAIQQVAISTVLLLISGTISFSLLYPIIKVGINRAVSLTQINMSDGF